MSTKEEQKDNFRVGYQDYETKDEAVKEATRRSLREWDTVPVWEKIGEATFDLSKLNPDLATYKDVQ